MKSKRPGENESKFNSMEFNIPYYMDKCKIFGLENIDKIIIYVQLIWIM